MNEKTSKKVSSKFLTDSEVEEEIARLKGSPAVRLAQKKARIDYRRRQYMYTLRVLEKKGQELMEAGITEEMLAQFFDPYEPEED